MQLDSKENLNNQKYYAPESYVDKERRGLTGQDINAFNHRPEVAYLVGLNLEGPAGELATEKSLYELKDLAEACGAKVLAYDYQNRDKVDPATFIGKGKLEQIAEEAKTLECNTLIFDEELSGSQMRNIQEQTKLRTIDRTMLILDIFARRASSKEGKLQVELAQYTYRLSRVSLLNEEYSRQGGMIGTRGPGETQLETDRRHIRNRITQIKRDLKAVSSRRKRQRKKRDEQGQTIVALVGYTNAGKSSLINYLSDADLLAKDQVFTTLDSAFRDLRLPDGSHVLLADTVGFIKKLPHQLVEAFNSTLAEVTYADLILEVVDVADPDAKTQVELINEVLKNLDAGDKPRILLLNKIDIATKEQIEGFSHLREDDNFRVVPVSAKTGENLDEVLHIIEKILAYRQKSYNLKLPYTESSLYSYIKEHGNLLKENFNETMNLDFTLDERLSGPVERYLRQK